MFADRFGTGARGPSSIAARATRISEAMSRCRTASRQAAIASMYRPIAMVVPAAACVVVVIVLAAGIMARVPAKGEMPPGLAMNTTAPGPAVPLATPGAAVNTTPPDPTAGEAAPGPSMAAIASSMDQMVGAEKDLGTGIECIALNIYHEARGEPDMGKLAVGHVVMNRVSDPHFPNVVCDVVRQGGELPRNRCQFSWWCDGRSDEPRNSAAWDVAVEFAERIFAGASVDPTGGALWYHADYVQPYWRRTLRRGPVIGHHVFYHPNGEPENQIAGAADKAQLAPPPRVIVPYAM